MVRVYQSSVPVCPYAGVISRSCVLFARWENGFPKSLLIMSRSLSVHRNGMLLLWPAESLLCTCLVPALFHTAGVFLLLWSSFISPSSCFAESCLHRTHQDGNETCSTGVRHEFGMPGGHCTPFSVHRLWHWGCPLGLVKLMKSCWGYSLCTALAQEI